MSLDAVIRNAINLASATFQPVKARVQHVTWTGQNGLGAASTVTVIRWPVMAIKRTQHRRADGAMVEVRAMLTFLEPIAPNGAPHRTEPVDVKDKFILPDGSSGPIVDVIGVQDQTLGRPFYVKVFLGVG